MKASIYVTVNSPIINTTIMDTSPKLPNEHLKKQTASMGVALIMTAVLPGSYLHFVIPYGFTTCNPGFR